MDSIKMVLRAVFIPGFVQLLVTRVLASGPIPVSYGTSVNGTIK